MGLLLSSNMANMAKLHSVEAPYHYGVGNVFIVWVFRGASIKESNETWK